MVGGKIKVSNGMIQIHQQMRVPHPRMPLCTRVRWGILPGQDALVMDISTLEVPEEDFGRLRQMQMSTMEWDEAGEAALRKGFRKGKRTKFMGERRGGGE